MKKILLIMMVIAFIAVPASALKTILMFQLNSGGEGAIAPTVYVNAMAWNNGDVMLWNDGSVMAWNDAAEASSVYYVTDNGGEAYHVTDNGGEAYITTD
jgi:hypothetical protein